MGTSDDVVVDVIPDPLTTVVGTVVDQNGLPVADAIVTTTVMASMAPSITISLRKIGGGTHVSTLASTWLLRMRPEFRRQ